MGGISDTCLGLIKEDNHLEDGNHSGERVVSLKKEVKASRVVADLPG